MTGVVSGVKTFVDPLSVPYDAAQKFLWTRHSSLAD